ncbi:MAG: NUDIX hydrolase [Woeseiaceae bacterium]|nr:NUDIX hydrolase [Woeseiaceae bacterium]
MSDNRILAVRQSKGHPLGGSWTIPWGTLESGESPAQAVVREVREESGIVAAVEGLLGVQELPVPWAGWFALLYLCRHVGGVATPDHQETDAATYLDVAQLRALDEPIEPWSEWFMTQVLLNKCTPVSASEPNPFSPEIGFI